MFTTILIVVVSLFVVVTVVNEFRNWGKSGHHIRSNAPMDDDRVNRARLVQDTNPHKDQSFGNGF